MDSTGAEGRIGEILGLPTLIDTNGVLWDVDRGTGLVAAKHVANQFTFTTQNCSGTSYVAVTNPRESVAVIDGTYTVRGDVQATIQVVPTSTNYGPGTACQSATGSARPLLSLSDMTPVSKPGDLSGPLHAEFR